MQIINAVLLVCPVCGERLVQEGSVLRCDNSHCFDVAKQGYVNLLPVQNKRSKAPGDSKEMVLARQRFLSAGLYQPIAELLFSALKPCLPEEGLFHLLDAGCGEGYYLNYLAQTLRQIDASVDVSLTGIDISKPAIVAAAKQYKQITWLVASNKQLPVIPGSLDMIVCMFGFPVYDAFSKALKPGGRVVLIESGEDHLIELRRVIYPQLKDRAPRSLQSAEQQGFRLTATDSLRLEQVMLNRPQLEDLLLMTPHLFRASAEGKQAVAELNELAVTVNVSLRVLELEHSIKERPWG